jgi:hypothetical protein
MSTIWYFGNHILEFHFEKHYPVKPRLRFWKFSVYHSKLLSSGKRPKFVAWKEGRTICVYILVFGFKWRRETA